MARKQADAPFQPRVPEYCLDALNKVTGRHTNVGSGWIHADGSISVTLHPFVLLDGNNQDLTLRMFLIKHGKTREPESGG